MLKKTFSILGLGLLVNMVTLSQDAPQVPRQVYGITIDGIWPGTEIIEAIENLPAKMTTRIVFDEGQPASLYANFINQNYEKTYIMGEILDSYYMKDISVAQYSARVQEYVNAFGNKVAIYEIGNEINGEWLGTDVVEKMTNAYNIVKNAGQKTALTLYYNKNCWANPQNEMFRWTNTNVPAYMKTGLDYVWISYYEDDCNNYQPNWQQVFDSLHTIFPYSKLGIGECGTVDPAKKQQYMQRYYKMNIHTLNYVGGYFWWYFRQDCTPKTKPLWAYLNTLMLTRGTSLDETGIEEENTTEIPERFELKQNFPNPFNPTTKISYSIPVAGNVKIVIYDLLGREVLTLINEYKQEGTHITEFKESSVTDGLASGIYIYKIEAGTFRDVRKMMLIK